MITKSPVTLILGCLSLLLSSSSPAVQVFGRQNKEAVSSLAFSPNGQMLAIGTSAPSTNGLPEGTIELWDLRTVVKLSITLHQSARSEYGDMPNLVGSISFSPDGKWVAGSDRIGYTLWDLATGREKYKWHYFMGSYWDKSVGWSGD